LKLKPLPFTDAIQKAIAEKPNCILPGAALFYGIAGNSISGAVYIVPDNSNPRKAS
jgi:hypothetical protein